MASISYFHCLRITTTRTTCRRPQRKHTVSQLELIYPAQRHFSHQHTLRLHQTHSLSPRLRSALAPPTTSSPAPCQHLNTPSTPLVDSIEASGSHCTLLHFRVVGVSPSSNRP